MRSFENAAAHPGGREDGATVLADVGGTNVRFALLANGVLGKIEHRQVSEHATFADALGSFIVEHANEARIVAAEFAVAGVVHDGRCALTNSPWIVDTNELRTNFSFARMGVVNDFEAIAHALPFLKAGDLCPLGTGRQALAGAPMAVLGPGTGLGVAALVPCGSDRVALASEGGHSTLPATSARESLIIAHLRRRFGHVSAERALSGAGLENLYVAISSLSRANAPPRTAPEISRAAIAGNCPTSKAAVDMFCAFLGTVAGNIALTYGARGGVFIAGGILPYLCDYIANSEFRARFEGKGRLRPFLEPIPVCVIMNTDAAFLGLRALAGEAGSPVPEWKGAVNRL